MSDGLDRVLALVEEAQMSGRSLTGKDWSAERVAEMSACECICCIDALERRRCGAFIAYACDCAEFTTDEQCTCRFCVSQLGS